jgi:cytochrome c553
MYKHVFLVLLAISAAAAAEEPGRQLVTQGNDRGAPACAVCHGADGAGNPVAGFPRLSGQPAAYLAKQLGDFAAGRRANPVMEPIAKALDAKDVAAVSAYFAALPAPATEVVGRAERPPVDAGERLALRGDWEHGIPECVTCHGPGGVGVGDHFPRLAGQYAGYIAGQLKAWQAGSRRNDPEALMTSVAKRLDDAQIQAVADYFARLARP